MVLDLVVTELNRTEVNRPGPVRSGPVRTDLSRIEPKVKCKIPATQNLHTQRLETDQHTQPQGKIWKTPLLCSFCRVLNHFNPELITFVFQSSI